MQGKRTEGEDSYTGTYQADYTRFSGTEILFGGTTVECEKGSTVEVECTLTIEEGEAIIFLQSGNNDPTVILQANDTFTANLRSVTEVAISEYGEKNLQVVQNLILSENFCRTTAKEKKPSFSRQSSCPNHTYGGFGQNQGRRSLCPRQRSDAHTLTRRP